MLGATRAQTERAALLALATSGLRRAELLALTWPDVDLPNRRLRIRGKGDKQREALIFDDLLPMLYALHAEQHFPTSGPVFRGRQGGPLQISTLTRWFAHWLQAAGLSAAGYTLHSLRRFAAKRWLESGLNIRQVQMLLGHENLQTTILYLNYDLDEIQRAAAHVSFGLSLDIAIPSTPTRTPPALITPTTTSR
jgi:integrase/recombinase XerC